MANCRIRIYVTCNSQGTPLSNELGHFDIQFDGTYPIDGRSYTNPVISYGGGDNNPGKIKIFNAARTAAVFPNQKFQAYTFSFSTSEDVNDVIDRILGYLDTGHETRITSNAYEYNVTSGPFATYTLEATNCFSATATFASWLGYNKLKEIFDDADGDYESYSAYNMWREYGEDWQHRGFYD